MHSAAVRYFKEEPGFGRLLPLYIEKFQSLGRIGGSVRLEGLTEQEKAVLSSFFDKNFRRQEHAVISMQSFEKALQKTKFAGIGLLELLTGYQGAPIQTKAEQKEKEKLKKTHFFTDLFRSWEHPESRHVCDSILQKTEGSHRFHRLYEANRLELKQNLMITFQAIQQLPQDKLMRLPLFAAQVTGNPHAFDFKSNLGKVLIDLLCLLAGDHGGKKNSEELTELLYGFGLLRDDLLNNVTCSGLIARSQKTGEPIASWQAALQEKRVQILPLRDLLRPIEIMSPSPAKIVYVVENSGVFSALLDEFADEVVDPPLVCVNGRCKLASLLLIDVLAKSEATIYYSGDFDPEGLSIADQLMKRHPHHVVPWRMRREDYERCRSDESLRKSRVKQLDRITSPLLEEAKTALRRTKKAGYQEQLLFLLKQDIQAGEGSINHANFG